jgi:hypothetical protein
MVLSNLNESLIARTTNAVGLFFYTYMKCKVCKSDQTPFTRYINTNLVNTCLKCNHIFDTIELPYIPDLKHEIMKYAKGELSYIESAKSILIEEGHNFDSIDIKIRTVAYSHLLAMVKLL